MEPTVATDGSAVILQLWAAAESKDMVRLRALVHDDLVMEWPQSGERFTGADNAIGGMTATEEKPEVAGEPRIVGAGDVWVVMAPLRYGTELHHYVGIFELDAGRVRRTTEYFGAPFPAQEARAQYTDH